MHTDTKAELLSSTTPITPLRSTTSTNPTARRPAHDSPLEQARRAGRSALLVEAHRALKAAGAAPMLTKREVAALRGVSQSTIDRMVRRGEFPPGEMVSPRKRGWRLSVVQAVPAAAPSPSQARKDGRFARDAA